jgi:hypothetical protein
MRSLLTLRTFWIITAFGNTFILIGALFLYFFEHTAFDSALQFIDCLEWSVATVTGTYGTLSATTLGGKVVSIIMRMGGAFFLWMYMALFIGILIQPELNLIGREVSEIQREVKDLTVAKPN